MPKIKVIQDEETGEQFVVMSYAEFVRIQKERARLQGLAGMDAEVRATLTRIECTPEQWADLQEWIGPLDEESGPAS